MARNKKFYVKDAREGLEQGIKMLTDADNNTVEVEALDIQTVRNAARQAQEAASSLWMLAGVMDSENPSGGREAKGQGGGKPPLNVQ